MSWVIWWCHIDHALLESPSWYVSTKFLNWFLKHPSCPRNIFTEHWRKLPNLTTFLDIYLYLKSKNNDNSAKHVKILLNLLFIYFSLHICQIPHVTFESTSHFPLNFASIFSAIRRNFSVLFVAQTYILVKGAN